MAVQTITIDQEAYEILKSLQGEGDSFSEVIKKNLKKPKTIAGFREALDANLFSEEHIQAVEEAITHSRRQEWREA